MKITPFDEAYSARLSTGDTTIYAATGSNSGFGGDVVGGPGDLSVVGLRSTVALSSNLTGNLHDVLTIVSTSPLTAAFAAPSNTTSSGSNSLPWFTVTAYGATGNGSTDDTAAINLAIAALNTATKGVLYFPAGTYKTTAGLTTITASGTILGDGMGQYSSTTSADFELSSTVTCTSATAVLFTITGGIQVRQLSLVNTAGGTPSAGSAIKVSGTDYRQHVTLDYVYVSRFYDAIDVQTNSVFGMNYCSVWNPIHYGLKLRNTVATDAGGASIIGCTFVSETQGATAGIRIESSGGNKIVSTNINNIGARCIDLAASANSSILIVEACSFENYTGDAIHADDGGHGYSFLIVTSNEFGQYSNGTGHAVYTTGVTDVVIANNTLRADTGTPTAYSLNSGSRGYVGGYTNNGFSTVLASSSFTTLTDDTGSVAAGVRITGTPSSGQVPVASSSTAAAWGAATATPSGAAGGDLSGTYPNPSVIDDSHSHTSATLPTSTSGVLLIADVHSTPIVFADLITNEAGTDLLYGDA